MARTGLNALFIECTIAKHEFTEEMKLLWRKRPALAASAWLERYRPYLICLCLWQLESCPHPDLDIFGLKAKFQSQSSQFLNSCSLLPSSQLPFASDIGEKARAAGSLRGAQRSVK